MNDPTDDNEEFPVIDPDREGKSEPIADIIQRMFQVGDHPCADCGNIMQGVALGMVCEACDRKRKKEFVKHLFRLTWDRFRNQVPKVLHYAMNGDPAWRDRWPTATGVTVDQLEYPQSVMLGGDSNAGKSTLAMALISLYAGRLVREAMGDPDPREVLARISRWRYRSAQALAEESLAAFIIPADVRKAPLLMIDDLGMDDTNDRRRVVIRDLLQERFDNDRCTVITTSLTMDEIGTRYGAGILTRLNRHVLAVKVKP